MHAVKMICVKCPDPYLSVILLDQEMIRPIATYPVVLVGATDRIQKPKAPSFQIRLGRNLAGLFFK